MATITKRGERWQVKIRRFGYPNQTATDILPRGMPVGGG